MRLVQDLIWLALKVVSFAAHLYIGTTYGQMERTNMKIPKPLRQAIVDRLRADPRPQSASELTEPVNGAIKPTYRKTPKQMSFVLKQMKRDGDLVIAREVKNGTTAHGNERTRKEYTLNHEVHDPDIVEESE